MLHTFTLWLAVLFTHLVLRTVELSDEKFSAGITLPSTGIWKIYVTQAILSSSLHQCSVILFLVYHFPPAVHFDFVAYSKICCQLPETLSENNTGIICFEKMNKFSLICDGVRLMRITISDWEGNYCRAGNGISQGLSTVNIMAHI